MGFSETKQMPKAAKGVKKILYPKRVVARPVVDRNLRYTEIMGTDSDFGLKKGTA